ncbi:hypothetical protein Hte_002302 [Hypoxylon texense]
MIMVASSLKNPHSRVFLSAEPEEGALVLNVGDMLQRFTNATLGRLITADSPPKYDLVGFG